MVPREEKSGDHQISSGSSFGSHAGLFKNIVPDTLTTVDFFFKGYGKSYIINICIFVVLKLTMEVSVRVNINWGWIIEADGTLLII